MSIDQARAAIAKAETKIAEGKQELDDAYNLLDVALAARGWTRMWGAFSSDARLYTQPGGNPVGLEDVIAHERRIAA